VALFDSIFSLCKQSNSATKTKEKEKTSTMNLSSHAALQHSLLEIFETKKCPRLKIGIDLDETMLSTFTEESLGEKNFALAIERAKRQESELPFLKRRVFYLYNVSHPHNQLNHVVVLRPRVREFLIELQKDCDFFVYTASLDFYAEAMTKLLFDSRSLLRPPIALMHRMHCFASPSSSSSSSLNDDFKSSSSEMQLRKPLQNVVQLHPHLCLPDLILLDNRIETCCNRSQFVLVPDFRPEWSSVENDFDSSDDYLMGKLLPIVRKMQGIDFYIERVIYCTKQPQDHGFQFLWQQIHQSNASNSTFMEIDKVKKHESSINITNLIIPPTTNSMQID
jgi:hypothetical protein